MCDVTLNSDVVLNPVLLTVVGYGAVCLGVGLTFGVGWALMVGGAVLFVAGGLGSAREGQ